MGPPNTLYNPEAGSHPLPADEREVKAVLRAGVRCYRSHPYFAERYGARGEAFTRSDGGYLATLVAHPQSYVDNQIEWLTVVLASRGMPRWLMEIHLDLLCEELSAALPRRAGRYKKLRRAAQHLRTRRLAWISEADFVALTAFFEARAGAGLRGAGGLLVAAVCDECCGLTKAVPSLISWLADPGRFSPAWCAAVAETLDRARAMAKPRAGVSS
ncbi:MAG: hypothetical protein WCO00_00150 [Rhodospirillaceae bacterium]